MGKRVTENSNEEAFEMNSIKQHLDLQDKTLTEILTVLRGSVAMGVDGIIAKQKEAEKSIDQLIRDVAHLQSWKKRVQENTGKLTIHWTDIAKTIFAIIGGIGTLIAGLLALKQILEK